MYRDDKIKTWIIYLVKKIQLQRPGCPHPTRQGRVVFDMVTSVWVDEDAEGFQPTDVFGEAI